MALWSRTFGVSRDSAGSVPHPPSHCIPLPPTFSRVAANALDGLMEALGTLHFGLLASLAVVVADV